MNRKQIFLSLMLAFSASTGFAQTPEQISEDFQGRSVELKAFETASRIKDMKLTPEARKALEFLYAYMPWPDVADYSLDYHVAQVEFALTARREMPWGKQVPEREWLHFVLPVRVNNENLDDFRTECYTELKKRVKGMTMAQAVMEVNHWCHEHVTYKPSDSRTSSPLASMKTATGRCGEESTYTVSALRAIGIPARQVYTPRWAHTDDNHAWVEAWVDGKWYFLGACEPEPVLNLAWFNQPASRGMLMHTKVFGRYDGPEDVISKNDCYTEINVTENYAKTARTRVHVVDEAGRAVPNARVDFKIYNYGELFTVQSTGADAEGKASILTGLGDMVVWASKEGQYGFAAFTAGKGEEIEVKLTHKTGDSFEKELTLVPPKGENNLPEVSEADVAANVARLAKEDEIRMAYVHTFADSAATAKLCAKLKLDYNRVRPLVVKSCGNWKNIFALLKSYPKEQVLSLLETLSDKDLRDFPLEVMKDHARYALASSLTDKLFSLSTEQIQFKNKYVYCPRVANEMLTAWRGEFNELPKSKALVIKRNPEAFAEWINTHVVDNSERNPLGYTLSPGKALEGLRADARNKGILFVAACRAQGVPARIDEVTGKVQYVKMLTASSMPTEKTAHWQTVDFKKAEGTTAASTEKTADLKLSYTPREYMENPSYYYHFSLSRLNNGVPVLQNYPEGDTWKSTFEKGTSVDAGDYLLTSGTRMADGTVLTKLNVFTVKPGEKADQQLVMREDKQGVQVIGNFNAENRYYDVKTDAVKSVLSTTGRGYYVIGLIRANHEPTNHILHDIEKLRTELEAWGRQILFVFPNRDEYDRFCKNRAEFTNLPSTVTFGIDTEGQVQKDLFGSGLTHSKELPLVVIADTFNRVVFSSQGYTIGLGERIKATVGKLK